MYFANRLIVLFFGVLINLNSALAGSAPETKTYPTYPGSSSSSISTAEGFGASARGKNAAAKGRDSTASGDGSTATGINSTASGLGSTATGFKSLASAENSVALGAYSVADRKNTVSVGNVNPEHRYMIKRQITNVAAGTEETDAVNVRQLNESVSDTLSSANAYSDNKISENNTVLNRNFSTARTEAINAGKEAANLAEKNANTYSDSKITDTKNELNTNINNAKNDAINTSGNHTDSKISDNNTVINRNISTARTEAISVSRNYTDSRVDNITGIAVEGARSYTDQRYEQGVAYAQNAASQAEQNAGHYTDTRFNQVTEASNQRFKQLGDKINRAEKRLNAGVAGVTAIASIPYVTENRVSYGIGLGNYSNGNAMATGVQVKTSPNTRVRLNVSWDSSHNSALGVGFAGGW